MDFGFVGCSCVGLLVVGFGWLDCFDLWLLVFGVVCFCVSGFERVSVCMFRFVGFLVFRCVGVWVVCYTHLSLPTKGTVSFLVVFLLSTYYCVHQPDFAHSAC